MSVKGEPGSRLKGGRLINCWFQIFMGSPSVIIVIKELLSYQVGIIHSTWARQVWCDGGPTGRWLRHVVQRGRQGLQKKCQLLLCRGG